MLICTYIQVKQNCCKKTHIISLKTFEKYLECDLEFEELNKRRKTHKKETIEYKLTYTK